MPDVTRSSVWTQSLGKVLSLLGMVSSRQGWALEVQSRTRNDGTRWASGPGTESGREHNAGCRCRLTHV